MCLAKGLNAVTPVSLEPAAPQSRVKHSTTEPLCSQMTPNLYNIVVIDNFDFNSFSINLILRNFDIFCVHTNV